MDRASPTLGADSDLRINTLRRCRGLGRLAGDEDVNDAERLERDPVMRAIADRKGLDRMAASPFAAMTAAHPDASKSPDKTGVWARSQRTKRPLAGLLASKSAR